jgi:hypothetical protein
VLAPVYRHAMLVCAALMASGGVLAWLLIPDRLTAHTPVKTFCDPCSPPVHPADSGDGDRSDTR